MSQRMPKRKGRYTKTNQINQLAAMVNELGQRVANLAAGIVVLETLLEDAGVLTEERVARIKPIVRKKLGIAEPTPPPAAEEAEPTACCELDNTPQATELCKHMTPVPVEECKE